VISIDTLRSDHLPAYGYKGVDTPAIDALAKDAILYERAYSHIPLTLPSHATLLTGLLPAEHGVRDNVGYVLEAKKHPHLPRTLKGAGYMTGAAVSAYVLRAETGMAEDFDFYDSAIDVKTSEALGRSQRPGKETAEIAEGWLHTVAAKPFFLLLHLYEPHTPYEPAAPFAGRYKLPYDGEIATADAIVGDFLADLKRRGIYDRAIVVLLSDHGEGLAEHGEQEHGVFLYREALQVPLLLKLPGGRLGGTRVAAPAGLIDLFPTLARLVGAPVPPELPGTSLLDLRDPKTPVRSLYAETYYPRLHLGWSELTSLVRDRFHYIRAPQPELFDLKGDPGERENVLTRERRTYAALRQELDGYQRPLSAPAATDEETARKLASLGYLGGSAIAGSDTKGPLPDPKERIGTLKDFGLAFREYEAQRYAQAVPIFERLVAANPRMVDAWEHLGLALQKLGRREEALAALQKAMDLSGGVAHVTLATATLLVDMGRLDEARKHAELGLATSPASAHSILAQVALAKKDMATAEKEARAALGAKGSQIGPLLTLAQVLIEAGKLDEALATTQKGVDELAKQPGKQRFAGLYYVRGDVLARLSRNPEAEQCFLREIADAPGDTKAYTRLSVLYASEGRSGEAVDALRRMVETNESPAAYAEAVKTLRVLGDPAGAQALLRHALSIHPESRELRAL
ncbi:MAG TPA: sulfatase-like hydrolase/transferase, partial [Thermoanaerobaculia bacterium]|nr:sulfatase-like hydrolase/transferase [Thermoanaerobaculia bacterium]